MSQQNQRVQEEVLEIRTPIHNNQTQQAYSAKRTNPRRRAYKEKEEWRLDTVVGICTAESYNFPNLAQFLHSTFPNAKNLLEEVVHVTVSDDKINKCEFFVFANGCLSVWGSPSEVSALVLRLKQIVQTFEIQPLQESQSESLFFRTERAKSFAAYFDGETIVLELAAQEPDANVTMSKLAFSNALVHSVKLSVLEDAVDNFIERVKPIPKSLTKRGTIPFGRNELLRLTGELLAFRANLNLHNELTYTPDPFWSEPHLEEYYERTAKTLDIRYRVNGLNKRLDYVNHIISVLREHLSERYSFRLEWSIIALIATEITFTFFHLYAPFH